MNNLRIINGFLSSHDSSEQNEFEKLYISLRKKEGRLFTLKEIKNLPDVPASHPHFKEWKIRKKSCNKLLRYLKKERRFYDVLEIGCGNGWLCSHFASALLGEVTGVDVNTVEIRQAQKAFSGIRNLHFISGDIRDGIIIDKKFDLIIFAASIQYFKSASEIIKIAMRHLTLQGEIHIIDSPFYSKEQRVLAQQRTKDYFNRIGFPDMCRFYFHHTTAEFEPFNYKIIYNPHSLMNKLMFRKNPFYWIIIKNQFA